MKSCRWHRLIENQVAVSRQEMPNSRDPLDSLSLPSTVTTNYNGNIGVITSTDNNDVSSAILRTLIVDSGEEAPPGKAVARVEQVQVLTHPSLVNANAVTVQQPKVLEHAQPVLTPIERLRRNDKMIISALADKHNILTELLKEDNV